MPETERAILTYEKLTGIEAAIAVITSDMRYVKECAEQGKLADGRTDGAVSKAQSTADDAVVDARLANKRLDKMIWWMLATLIGMVITVGGAVMIFLIQKGLK